MDIWTVGHSTREIGDFIAALRANKIKLVADVRMLPGSRRHPQFNGESLTAALWTAGIRYEHFPELGGRRKPRAESRNTAWRNEAFGGYADYMETDEFRKVSSGCFALQTHTVAPLMCAEAVWWRCHRALISDFVKSADVEVRHIMDAEHIEVHPFTSAARVVNGKLNYAADSLL